MKNYFALMILQIVLLYCSGALFLVKTIHLLWWSDIIFISKLYFVCVSHILSLHALYVILLSIWFFRFHVMPRSLYMLIVLYIFNENIVVFEYTFFAFSVCLGLNLMNFLFSKLIQIFSTDINTLLLKANAVSKCRGERFI